MKLSAKGRRSGLGGTWPAQRIPEAPRLVENRPIWQTQILGISRTFQEFGEQRRVGEGRKKPNWPFGKSATGQKSKSAPKMDDLSGTFQDKA